MRRAIIYVAWGEKFVREAQTSAVTAGHVGADRVLITDPASHRSLPFSGGFERVITYEFQLSGYARKTEMLDLLPDEYGSFLFLDTDTRVLMGIDQAFERAERHGMAAAQAPHYSLEHFGRFSEHLQQIGFRSEGLLHYNSGVLFFTRDLRAWSVMKTWQDFCRQASVSELEAWTDQPYLTLAMEQAGFNPYTLSTAYNYRNFGELVSGYIRIWHSWYAPLPDVNEFAASWPPRRFFNSVRLPQGAG